MYLVPVAKSVNIRINEFDMLFIKAYSISEDREDLERNLSALLEAAGYRPEYYSERTAFGMDRIKNKIMNLRHRGVMIKTLYQRWGDSFTIPSNVLETRAAA